LTALDSAWKMHSRIWGMTECNERIQCNRRITSLLAARESSFGIPSVSFELYYDPLFSSEDVCVCVCVCVCVYAMFAFIFSYFFKIELNRIAIIQK